MHGIMWCKPEDVERYWRYGYIYIGKFVNEQTILYITKYMLKYTQVDKNFEPKVLCSKGITKAHEKASEKSVQDFVNYCLTNKLEYIQNLQNKHVINYREHLRKTKPKGTIGSLNTSLKNVNAFLNHCSDVAHYIPKITKKVLFNPTIKDIVESKRSCYTNEEYKKILDNIDLIKFTPKKMKATSYRDWETIRKTNK